MHEMYVMGNILSLADCFYCGILVRVGYHVSSGESALHAGGNGDEWMYCRDEQVQHSVPHTAS